MAGAELRDVASGLWVWRLEHPAWHEGYDWEPLVTSTVVESGGEVALIDPLAPPEDEAEIWERLDANPPTMAVILKPDHVRDVDLFAHRYDLRAASAPTSSGAATRRGPSSKGSSRSASCPAGSSRSTTAVGATRRRSGFPSSVPSSSPMR